MGTRNSKGEGTFKINKDGSVTHTKYVGRNPITGKRKAIVVKATSKAECIRLMKKKEREWEKEAERLSTDVEATLLELCTLHLKYQIENGELKPKSVDRRETTLHLIENMPVADKDISEVNSADIEDCIARMIASGKWKQSSIDKTIDVMNAAYRWAVSRGDCAKNPVEPIRDTLKKRTKTIALRTVNDADVSVLSEEEQERFVKEALKRCKHRNKPYYSARLYLLLLLYTGMRCGELLALRWKDVDIEKGFISIEKSRSMAKQRSDTDEESSAYVMVEGKTKNYKVRNIQLSQKARDVLRLIYDERTNFKAPEDFVVISERGTPYTTQNLEKRFYLIMRNAKIDMAGGLHILRKTFATNLYDSGKDVLYIASYIGDVPSTVERYYISRQKKVVDEKGRIKHFIEKPF